MSPEERESQREASRRYHRLHPEMTVIQNNARRGVTLDREHVKILVRDPCVYCGKRATGVDHITPIVSGGDSGWDNLAGACRDCNRRKHATPMLFFLLRRAPIVDRLDALIRKSLDDGVTADEIRALVEEAAS